MQHEIRRAAEHADLPGVHRHARLLPVINRKAFELALKTAVALNCEIARFTKWDRKNYYYPDLPKGYQISQFDLPMSRRRLAGDRGEMSPLSLWERAEAMCRKCRIRILRAHLEEDAGKSMHDESGGKDEGVPLLGTSSARPRQALLLRSSGTPLVLPRAAST